MSDQIKSFIPAALVPAGVSDARQHALAQAFGEALAKLDLGALAMADPMTVDARLLPFMIREFAAQDFIDPDIPAYVQRRVLKDIWSLKSLHGYDAGVRLGLGLLGMQMLLTHWHQEVPKGPANTNTITFLVGEALFDEAAVLGPRIIAAAHRMIDATKRWSQESTIRIGVNMRPDLRIAPVARTMGLSLSRGIAARPTAFMASPGLAPVAANVAVQTCKGAAKRPSQFGGAVAAVAGVRILQINRVSAQAA